MQLRLGANLLEHALRHPPPAATDRGSVAAATTSNGGSVGGGEGEGPGVGAMGEVQRAWVDERVKGVRADAQLIGMVAASLMPLGT